MQELCAWLTDCGHAARQVEQLANGYGTDPNWHYIHPQPVLYEAAEDGAKHQARHREPRRLTCGTAPQRSLTQQRAVLARAAVQLG